MSAAAVVIGASAGALDALSVILPALPAQYALPVMIVVHLPPHRPSILADLFGKKCSVDVVEARDTQLTRSGTVYFAPPDHHLLVERDKSLALSNDEPVLYSRPSVDVFFESAAKAYGPSLVAVILTGANQDGAKGLKAVVDAGGTAIIQHPDGAYASPMPKAAIAACPGARVLPLAQIALHLQALGTL